MSERPGRAREPARAGRAAVLLLAALVGATFFYVPRFFFTQDDFGWLLLARDAWDRPLALFTAQHGSFTPLANAVFRALVALGGLTEWPFYLLNLALHLAATVLVLRLAEEALGDRFAAIAAAGFFALTFSHWEAVMWLAGGMPQILATCCVLAAVLFFGAHLETDSVWPLAGSIAALSLGLLSKETAATAPLLVALYAWLLVGRREPGAGPPPGWARRLARSLTPLVVVGAAYLVFQAVGYRFSRLIDGGLYPARVGRHVLDNLVRYLFSLLAPDPRSPIVAGHLESLSPALAAALRPAAELSVWLLPLGVAALVWRGGAAVRFATLWILVALLPFLPITLAPAARYLYLPSVGAALLFGILSGRLRRAWGFGPALALLAAVLAVSWTANLLAGQTRLRNSTERRAALDSVLDALERRPETSSVRLAEVPERHADLCDAVRLYAKREVRCTVRAPGAGSAATGADPSDLVWTYPGEVRPEP